jgi:hypothetical protein
MEIASQRSDQTSAILISYRQQSTASCVCVQRAPQHLVE